MRQILIQDDVKLVEDKITQFEAATGCELLIVITTSSDPYPGASWRFGVIGGFLLSFMFSYYFDFHHHGIWPVVVLAFMLFMTWVGHFPWAKRLALSDWETERECAEKAIEYFHTLGTSKVSHKVTAMIMVSRLEKKIQVLIDEELKVKISQEHLTELVNLMKVHFKKGDVGLGLVASIQQLEDKILMSWNGKVTNVSPSELSNTVHFLNL